MENEGSTKDTKNEVRLWLTSAVTFLECAKLYRTHAPLERNSPWVTLHNLSFATESALKAYILYCDGQESDFMHISHDLERALEQAESRGLESVSSDIKEAICRLNKHYRTNKFRYLRDEEYKDLPDEDQALKIIEGLIRTIGGQMPDVIE